MRLFLLKSMVSWMKKNQKPVNCSQVRLEHFISSLVRGAESSEICSADTAPFAQSKLIGTVEKAFVPDKKTNRCPGSQSSKTLKSSTVENGKEPLTSSVGDSHALATRQRASDEVKKTNAICGRIPSGLFAKWDHPSLSWKTYQGFLRLIITA